MVFENVPGAFSTNGGKDFAAVLEEAIKVAEPEAPDVPVPDKGWPTSGCIMGDSWSVAWRVLDAQFWGVPQRRRRIALVADFGGQSAPEILFIRKGVSRDFDESEQTRKATAGDARECSGGAVPCTLKIRGGCDGGGKGALIQEVQPVAYNGSNITSPINKTNPQPGDPCHTLTDDSRNYLVQTVTFEPGIASREGGHVYNGVSGTLRANAGDNQMSVAYSIENHPADSRVDIDDSGKVQTLTSRMGTGGGNVPMVMEPAYCIGNGQVDQLGLSEKVGTLNCMHDQQAVLIPAVAHTLRAKASGGFSLNCNQVVRVKHIVRRLTPLECERLQGYPDGWTDIGEWVDSKGKKHKEADSPRYKALGNSIALPPWKWVLKRLCACYERDATMASLFDGIGGFPYIWEQLNGKGSCLWASEIEEFPMAVTKIRFGGNMNEDQT
jgi:DNA (cytosine-5)-methyltransferase 1